MIKTYSILIVFLLVISNNVYSQWDTLSSFNQVIIGLKTFNNKLFMGGNFTQNEGNNCYWSAYYDGSIIQRHLTQTPGSGIRKLEVFNNELYSVGTMSFSSMIGVAKWNGSTWVDGGSTNYSHSAIYTDGDTLYVADDFGRLRRKTPSTNFQTILDLSADGGTIHGIIKYNGNLVIAGDFDTINGVSVNNIALWDGTNWSPLGAGISENTFCVQVYNNELYVGGMIYQAGGQTVHGIARWNGSIWDDVAGGETATSSFLYSIREMKVHNNKLIVVGDFSEMGGVATNDVAIWDGSMWHSLNLDHNDQVIDCVEIFNNAIYVGSYNFAESHVFYHSTGVLDLETNEIEQRLTMYPNPVNEILTINFSSFDQQEYLVQIYDLKGKKVLSKSFYMAVESNVIINCENLMTGTYIAHVTSKDGKISYAPQKIMIK